jgi:hypothetical protein
VIDLSEFTVVPEPTAERLSGRQHIDVGLVGKRQHTERGRDGFHTYYRATVFGEVTLTSGVDELIHGEADFEAMYDSSTAQ